MWSIVKFDLFGWKRCVLFKYQLITNQLQIKQIIKGKDLFENKTIKTNNNNNVCDFFFFFDVDVCDLLLLAKRHEYRWRISKWVYIVLYYYSHIHYWY